MGITSAAHEDVYSRKGTFRPRMDGDVAFSEDHHPGDAAIRREMVEMTMQDRGPGGYSRFPKRAVDMLRTGKVGGVPKVDKKMGPSETLAVSLDKVISAIFALIARNLCNRRLVFARKFRDHPQLSKCVHHVPPNQ